MKRTWIFLAVLALVATFALRGGKEVNGCDSVRVDTITAVNMGAPYDNHGQYVRAAAHHLRDFHFNISEPCHDCIMAGFAQSDPEGAVCGGLIKVGD